MEVLVRGRNCTIPESVRVQAERKIGGLSRFVQRAGRAEVEVASEKTQAAVERYVVQVTLDANGTLIRSQERALTMPLALNAAADKLRNQLTRYKEKLHSPGRGATATLRGEPVELVEEGEDLAAVEMEGAPLITRVKRFPMKPMDVDEAVQQMELLGHAFFLFLDSESGLASLLYRREDNTYGLIQPEID